MMGAGPRNPKMMSTMMIAMLDTDGDQAASFDEVVTVHKRIFDMVDENKDGRITRDEAAAFFGGDKKPAMDSR